eukprot:4057936-Prymnesium_polylepis.1
MAPQIAATVAQKTVAAAQTGDLPKELVDGLEGRARVEPHGEALIKIKEGALGRQQAEPFASRSALSDVRIDLVGELLRCFPLIVCVASEPRAAAVAKFGRPQHICEFFAERVLNPHEVGPLEVTVKLQRQRQHR